MHSINIGKDDVIMTILDKIRENASKNPDRLMMIQKMNDEEKTLLWKELADASDYLLNP